MSSARALTKLPFAQLPQLARSTRAVLSQNAPIQRRHQTAIAQTLRFKHTIPRPPRISPFSSTTTTSSAQPSTSEPSSSPSSSSSDPSSDPSNLQTPSEGSPTISKIPQSNSAYIPVNAKRDAPQYHLTFTCLPCGDRSTHKVSKQGYHHGSVLITCPTCRNRHIISDHLQIFGNRKITVEDLMRERGMLVKKGTLGEDGDIEFWEDGTTSVHTPLEQKGEKLADDFVPGSTFKTVRPPGDKPAEGQ
ncbi:DNL zinc finger-domain-containing protein [Diplogelasinospora grovesii]|uniref:DNL zinc finger-domain-containing protein n=1 Tax=Diplogelasinospora grovesii TaxID=303347 RepID=A0AAN6S5T9_9PEZI|nr:DNL zinc finger-domain-containing protein [Diplogelasinospora grovesii]